MKEAGFQNNSLKNSGREINPLMILAVWFAVLAMGAAFWLLTDDTPQAQSQTFLLPWVFLTGAVIVAPSVYLFAKKQFTLQNPIIFAAGIYFFPAFFIGGLIFASGLSDPFFLNFIQDPKNDLPFTMTIVMLGYGGLSLGFLLPFGKKIGERFGGVLPKMDWKTENLFFPGFILLLLGLFNTITGYISGVIGYQKLEEIGIFDGILFLLTLIWMEAAFLLWLVIFRRNKLDLQAVFTASVLIITSLIKVIYAGNRGGLLSVFIMVALAYVISGRKISFKQSALGGVLLILSILIGMVYGTTFRNIKGSESQIGMEQYTEHIYLTLETISTKDNYQTLQQGIASLGERIDAVSSLAVVVSNYEKLAPFEEGYGLDNNIWKDTATFFIPRVVWQNKPLASEPRKYGDLYFNFGENSFTITPMGDLLRNFGVIGVPLGMMFLGFLLRILYVLLMENKEFSYWRATLYFMLMTAISYESFFGSIIPYLTKVAVISIVGILIVNFFTAKQVKKIF